MASGRLISLVGAGRYSSFAPIPRTSKRLQVKMKMKRVRARGTTLAPRGPMESSTWVWTAPTAISHRSWNLPGTPLVALARRIRPSVTTMAPAISVAHTMSMLMVRPNTWRWTWSPTEISIPSIGVSRFDPNPMLSGTSTGVVAGVDRGRRHHRFVVVDHVGIDHVVDRRHRSSLGHRAGHVGDQDDLEHGQSTEDAET